MKENELRSLLKKLSIQEKIGQLIQLSGEFFDGDNIVTGPQQKLGISDFLMLHIGSVLNVVGAEKTKRIQDNLMSNMEHPIPVIFMSDIIYGMKTVYPIPLGLGATWNPELIKKAFEQTASETKASGNQVTFAPMVDLARDARWGRDLESTGEDPFLNSQFAKSMVQGLQFGLENGEGIVSCVKHFAAYGAVESGREYNQVELSERKLRQEYLPSYKAAIDAGAKMVMSSFNTINGVPVTGDDKLLKKILRDEWGFDGVLISDYAAISELVAHGFAENNREATLSAFNAGIDIDMKSPCYANELAPLVSDGLLDEKKIEEAVWRILKLKNELGLFEDPYRGASVEKEQSEILTAKKRKIARDVSSQALVLLKNEENILPLNSEQKIALIGPYADEKELLGLWAVHGDRKQTITIHDGFNEYLDNDHLKVAKGTDILRDKELLKIMGLTSSQVDKSVSSEQVEKSQHNQAIEIAKKADVIVLALGEHTVQSGEAGSRTILRLPENQNKLIEDLSKLDKPMILINISGRPLVFSEIENKFKAIIQAWFPGTEGGHAIADVIFGRTNPSGRLTMSFPVNEGQLPIYYGRPSTGRPLSSTTHTGRYLSRYLDAPNDPLYPFGFGLSYNNAKYSSVHLSTNEITDTETCTVEVEVENISDVDGIETVQVYMQDIFASVVQPTKRLIGFKKVTLLAKSKVSVSFEINPEMLKFYNQNNEQVIEPGDFRIYVGPDSNTENYEQLTYK